MMRIWLSGILLLTLLFGCGEDDNSGSGNDEDGAGITVQYQTYARIVLEPENGSIIEPMAVFSEPDISGGKYILAPEGPNHEALSLGGSATLSFDVIQAGKYTLWVRAKWCCDCGNSIGIKLDGVDYGNIEDAILGTWHWVAMTHERLDLKTGTHMLTLSNTEDGAAIDQILLTQDKDYRPTGIEVEEAAGDLVGK